MAAQLIPLNNQYANFQLKVSLDGTNYIFVFTYNDRTSVWDLCVQDSSGNQLVNGISMVPKYPLNYRFSAGQVPGMFPGTLLLIDETGQNRTPNLSNFGNGINLFYVPIADIQAAG